ARSCQWKNIHGRHQRNSKPGAINSAGGSHIREGAEGQWPSGCHVHVGRQCCLRGTNSHTDAKTSSNSPATRLAVLGTAISFGIQHSKLNAECFLNSSSPERD